MHRLWTARTLQSRVRTVLQNRDICSSSDIGSGVGLYLSTSWPTAVAAGLREAPDKKMPGLFGHCPNSDCTPPPSLKRALWGTLFPDRLEQMPFELQFSLHKCPKPSWQGFRPPKPSKCPFEHGQFFSKISAPNHLGKGRDPPPFGQCPNRPGFFLIEASLSHLIFSTIKYHMLQRNGHTILHIVQCVLKHSDMAGEFKPIRRLWLV